MTLTEKLNLPATECLLREKDEAPAYLGCSARTLARLRASGDGPPFRKFGRQVLYLRADLLAWSVRKAA